MMTMTIKMIEFRNTVGNRFLNSWMLMLTRSYFLPRYKSVKMMMPMMMMMMMTRMMVMMMLMMMTMMMSMMIALMDSKVRLATKSGRLARIP